MRSFSSWRACHSRAETREGADNRVSKRSQPGGRHHALAVLPRGGCLDSGRTLSQPPHLPPPESPDINYPSRNNRLLAYYVFDRNDPGNLNDGRLLRTVRYVYYVTGHVADIMIQDHYIAGLTPGSPADYAWTRGLALYYNLQGQLATAIWDRWRNDVPAEPFFSYDFVGKRDFFYDGPTELVAVKSYHRFPGQGGWSPVAREHRTDYLCGAPLGDYQLNITVDTQQTPWVYTTHLHEATRYLAGNGLEGEQWLDPDSPDPENPIVLDTVSRRSDLIRSGMMLTGTDRLPAAQLSYTAFGEPVWTDAGGPHVGGELPAGFDTVYGYAGGFGYQTGHFGSDPCDPSPNSLLSQRGVNPTLPPIILTHVGFRWYDASIGRFVQRDPIGLRGGRNVYVYVGANSVSQVDPLGLYPDDPDCWPQPTAPPPKPSTQPPVWTGPVLVLTGGEDSWLDDPIAVARARRFFARVAFTCLSSAAGGIVGPGFGISAGIGGALVNY